MRALIGRYEDAQEIARKVWGSKQGAHVVDVLCRVESFDVRKGQRPVFRSAPFRDPNERGVRRALALLASVCERMAVDSGRAISQRLWLGHGRAGRWGLAYRLGVGPWELSRYLLVLDAGGVLKSWQPPAKELAEKYPQLVGRRSGHAYRAYEWCTQLPRELVQRLTDHWGGAKKAPEMQAPEAPRKAPWSASSADAFAHLIPPPT